MRYNESYLNVWIVWYGKSLWVGVGSTRNRTDTDIGISISTGNMTSEERTELWQVRMRELSGAIAVSALVQVFIGVFGE